MTGASSTGDAIRGNSIFSNGKLGIDLTDGATTCSQGLVTPNDGPGDGDTGPNNLQNFPVITSAVYNGVNTTITGSLDTPSPNLTTVDVYSTQAGDPEGHFWLGSAAPGLSGAWTVIYSGAPPYGTLTATDTDASGNTSEFTSPAFTPPVGPGMALTTVAFQGQSAPGTGGGNFSGFGPADVPNAGGDVVFWASVSPGSVSQAVFRCHIAIPLATDCVTSGSTITKLVAAGDVVLGHTITGLGAVPIINSSGDVVFFATFGGGSGIYKLFSGSFTKVVESGDSTPAGGTYTSFTAPLGASVPVMNNNGDVAFFANTSLGQGIFLYQASGPTVVKVAATGGAAPTGGTFTGFFYPGSYGTTPIVNDSGQVAFWALVSVAAGQGAFLWDSGTITKIAAGGDTVPGGGATYVTIGQVPAANTAGQMLFSATLSAGAVNCTNISPSPAPCGMYLKTPSGTAKLLQSGDPGPAGVAGVVSGIGTVPVGNSSGQVTVWLGITGGAASQAILRYNGGEMENVAAIGNTTPIGGTFSSFIDASTYPTVPTISNGGQVSLWGAVIGGSGPSGLFITAAPVPGSTTINLGPIQGGTVPIPGGGNYGPGFDLGVNNGGTAVFSDTINGNPAATDGLFLFFAGQPVNTTTNTATAIATNGDRVGITPDQFSFFGSPANNDAAGGSGVGNVAVQATLCSYQTPPAPCTGSTGQGLYLFFAGNPTPTVEARTGIGGFTAFGDPSLNLSNHLAATADQGTTHGLYLFFAGNPTTLATTSTSAPGGDTFAIWAPIRSGTRPSTTVRTSPRPGS